MIHVGYLRGSPQNIRRLNMINLSKAESLRRIDLRKNKIINLKKTMSLGEVTSRVALVLDYSGSMETLYDNGAVQELLERILPLALAFDDNGELDLWIFDNHFRRFSGVTRDNFYGITQWLRREYPEMGGTMYAPVIQDVAKFYVKENPENIPSYVLFVTDGENSDRETAEEVIAEVSRFPIFFQFVGIGYSSFNFLRKLDEMEGRYVDNANFFTVADFGSVTDDQLYSMLLQEYPLWLGYPQVQRAIQDIRDLGVRWKPAAIQKHKGFFGRLLGL